MSAALVRRGLELLSADISECLCVSSLCLLTVSPHCVSSLCLLTVSPHCVSSLCLLSHLCLFTVSPCCVSSLFTILKQNSGRQSKNHVGDSTQRPQKPQSVFTEEEFQQFQREYFGRTLCGTI
uniref:Active regulator of SIRT1 n=1 Tax=Periophthalmus magnuspinnatus TaxID=409849 RepID=A0A3B4B3K9_9GOBI